jgi:hypothetical protein
MDTEDEGADLQADEGLPAPEPKAPKQTNKGGRPAFNPTHAQRALVRSMAANRVPQHIIARNVLRHRNDLDGIDEKTLRRVFRRELDEGYARTVASMGVAVVRSGLAGNVAAQRYWLETHGGDEWKRTGNVRHGLMHDTQAAVGSNALVAPVLVIQPVKAIDVDSLPKPNGHDKTNGHAHDDAAA